MPLTTVSLPSGVPTGAGTEADPFVWTGRVAETFSNAVYAKAFDNYLLSRVTRLPAASAFNLRRITAYEAGAGAAEGATTTETAITGAVERSLLTTYRAQQTISAELLADSDAMQVVGNLLALELAEKVSAACADAVEAASWDATAAGGAGAYRDNVITGGITGGIPTIQTLSALVFGTSSALNGFAAGNRFTMDQRSRLCMMMSGDTLTEFVRTAVTGNIAGILTSDDGVVSVLGVPICTTVGMHANATTTKGGLHVACVDPANIILAEQPMVLAVDTEALAANNQVMMVAMYRAAAFLSIRTNATGLTLRTMA